MVKRADMEQVEKCEAPAENGPPPRLCAGFVGADQGALGLLWESGTFIQTGAGGEGGRAFGRWKWFRFANRVRMRRLE